MSFFKKIDFINQQLKVNSLTLIADFFLTNVKTCKVVEIDVNTENNTNTWLIKLEAIGLVKNVSIVNFELSEIDEANKFLIQNYINKTLANYLE